MYNDIMDALVKEYIATCKYDEDDVKRFGVHIKVGNMKSLVSTEALIIFILGKGSIHTYEEARDIATKHKGLINTYAIAFLKNKAGSGGRNSGTYTQLLKEYLANDDISSADDKVIINFDLVNDSENKL